MHAVAGAVDVAAGNALVRLHDVEAFAPPRRARRARERPVAPEIADVEGIDGEGAARAPTGIFSANQCYFRAASLERRHGAGDEALRSAVGVVFLSDDRDFQFASSSRAAAC